MSFRNFVKRVAQIFYGPHGFENYHGTNYPTEALAEWFQQTVRYWFYKIRIDICFGEDDGFDVGAFCGNWKRALGPFMFHQQYVNESAYAANDSAECYGPWRLMIALTKKAYDGFDQVVGK